MFTKRHRGRALAAVVALGVVLTGTIAGQVPAQAQEDTTGPVVTLTLSPEALYYATGDEVTVTFTAEDPESTVTAAGCGVWIYPDKPYEAAPYMWRDGVGTFALSTNLDGFVFAQVYCLATSAGGQTDVSVTYGVSSPEQAITLIKALGTDLITTPDYRAARALIGPLATAARALANYKDLLGAMQTSFDALFGAWRTLDALELKGKISPEAAEAIRMQLMKIVMTIGPAY